MVDKEKNTESKQVLSSLGSFNFNTLTKEEALEKFEKVLLQREKQIEDLSLLVGNYNDKLMSKAYERIKYLENENTSLQDKLTRKEKLLEQELENKEIMFIRMQALENDLDNMNQKKQKDTKKANPIDSFFNFLGGKKNEKINDPIKEENKNVYTKSTSNSNTLSTNSNETINSKPQKNVEEKTTPKPTVQNDSSAFNNQTTVTQESSSSVTASSSNEDKSIKLLDKIKALKKKNTEKIVINTSEDKKEESSGNNDGATK